MAKNPSFPSVAEMAISNVAISIQIGGGVNNTKNGGKPHVSFKITYA